MDWASQAWTIIPPAVPADSGKYVVVLDLDETLVWARGGPVVFRPGVCDLVDVLDGPCETVVWTAGERSYAQGVLRDIDPRGTVRHCVYRHPKWFDGRPGQLKDLRLLGRDMDRVLVIENTPDCVRMQAANAVLVPDYHGAVDDMTLARLAGVLRALVASGRPVPDFLRNSPHLSLQAIRTDAGEPLHIHALGDVSRRGRNYDTIFQQEGCCWSTLPATCIA